MSLNPNLNLNPDKGFGEPGSLRFHKLTILGLDTAEEVLEYLTEIIKPKLNDPKLNLPLIKEFSLVLLEEIYHGGSKS